MAAAAGSAAVVAQLAAYLAELRAASVEVPLEPELKANRQEQDKQIR